MLGLLVIFKLPEQSSNLRNWLAKDLNGFEVSPGVWLLKNGSPPHQAILKIVPRLESATEGVAVIRLGRHESQVGTHNFQALADWFEPGHEPGQ